ncbi:MAG: hypothetical protein QMD86_02665 [Patescibacteria group bacterium]|nr:hypothetical protein [Patescibacteria group bacterium]
MDLFIKFFIKAAIAAEAGGSPGEAGGSPGITSVDLPNPLGTTDIFALVNRAIGILFKIAAPIATIMILYGAYEILTSAGDPKKLESGKNVIKYSIIGLAIIALLMITNIPSLIKDILGI